MSIQKFNTGIARDVIVVDLDFRRFVQNDFNKLLLATVSSHNGAGAKFSTSASFLSEAYMYSIDKQSEISGYEESKIWFEISKHLIKKFEIRSFNDFLKLKEFKNQEYKGIPKTGRKTISFNANIPSQKEVALKLKDMNLFERSLFIIRICMIFLAENKDTYFLDTGSVNLFYSLTQKYETVKDNPEELKKFINYMNSLILYGNN